MSEIASKILESGITIPDSDIKVSLVGPFQPDIFTAQGMEALQQPSRAKAASAHLVRNALGLLFNANFGKLFNEFLIAKILKPKLGPEQATRSILPFGVADHHTP